MRAERGVDAENPLGFFRIAPLPISPYIQRQHSLQRSEPNTTGCLSSPFTGQLYPAVSVRFVAY